MFLKGGYLLDPKSAFLLGKKQREMCFLLLLKSVAIYYISILTRILIFMFFYCSNLVIPQIILQEIWRYMVRITGEGKFHSFGLNVNSLIRQFFFSTTWDPKDTYFMRIRLSLKYHLVTLNYLDISK